MKKIIYTGTSRNQDYLSQVRFLRLMEHLGAEEVLADFQHWVYSFQGVSILRRELPVPYSSIESITSCSLELVGERENISLIEQKILVEQERLDSARKRVGMVHLGLQD